MGGKTVFTVLYVSAGKVAVMNQGVDYDCTGNVYRKSCGNDHCSVDKRISYLELGRKGS